jgi:signal transduction histidine kinase
VSDTGIGIAPEDLARVFEKFERIERPGSDVKGTGLGLAIAKGLVERMGGRIWMESEPGKGTRVIFTLPRTRETQERPFPEPPA